MGMTKAEVDDIFGEFEIDEDYSIKTKEVISLFVAVKEEEKKEPTPPPVVEEAPPEEEEEGCQVNTGPLFNYMAVLNNNNNNNNNIHHSLSALTRRVLARFDNKFLFCL